MANSQGDSLNTDSDDELYCDALEYLDPDEECGHDFALENSTQLPSKLSMHPNASKVDEMEYHKVIDLMKYLNIESTECGHQDRTLLKELLYAKKWTGSYEDKMKDTVNTTMKKHIAEKKKLYETYFEIQEMARTDAFKKEVSLILEERFPKYMGQLQKNIAKLKTDEIEICVIGWTCAGKSTFFNILLGEEIMPTSCLPNTSCLVRLHNSQTREIQFVDETKVLKTVPLTADAGDAKRKLKSIIDQWHGSNKSLNAVDLYWPIPRLHENVVFVDTPGIGEKNVRTQQVIQHVPNAAGYICIINSGDGGGILEGGIIQLVEVIKAITDREGEREKNLGNILFVCNKWDLINKQDRETVWEHTRNKLRQYCCALEDWQIIQFSASVELQLMQLKASPTDDFVKILCGLERLISRTIKRLFFDFSGWIDNLIVKSVGIIDTKMSLLSLSNAELVELTTKMGQMLEDARKNLECNSKKIETLVATKKAEIVKDLQEYLKSPGVQQRVCDWRNDAPPLTKLKTVGPVLVTERINKLISEWAEKEEGLLQKGIASIEEECMQLRDEIQACFVSIHEMVTHSCPEIKAEVNRELFTRAFGLSLLTDVAMISVGSLVVVAISSEVAALVFNLLLGPLLFTANLLILYMVTNSVIKSIMTKLTLEAMKKVSNNETTENLVTALFEHRFKNWIEDFRSDTQREISSGHKTVQELREDLESGTDHISTLKPLLHELVISLTHLKKIGVEYYSDNSVSCECLHIESSSVSTKAMFHLHAVSNQHQGKRFTLRVIHPNYSVFHIQEIQKLRKMKHIHFMPPEGVVYSTSIPEVKKACGCSVDSLRLLVPKSIGDLESYVFANQRVQGCHSGELAEGFFKRMTLGIANGLLYVHEMGFIHGYLQLSSIMLADDMTPKLCDINILPSLQERHSKICIFHTAPEVIEGKEYGPKADIYSLGILLWELWYGRHTPAGKTLTENSVCNGERPQFEMKCPKKAWIDLMQSCWTDYPDRRPSAAECVWLLPKSFEIR